MPSNARRAAPTPLPARRRPAPCPPPAVVRAGVGGARRGSASGRLPGPAGRAAARPGSARSAPAAGLPGECGAGGAAAAGRCAAPAGRWPPWPSARSCSPARAPRGRAALAGGRRGGSAAPRPVPGSGRLSPGASCPRFWPGRGERPRPPSSGRRGAEGEPAEEEEEGAWSRHSSYGEAGGRAPAFRVGACRPGPGPGSAPVSQCPCAPAGAAGSRRGALAQHLGQGGRCRELSRCLFRSCSSPRDSACFRGALTAASTAAEA